MHVQMHVHVHTMYVLTVFESEASHFVTSDLSRPKESMTYVSFMMGVCQLPRISCDSEGVGEGEEGERRVGREEREEGREGGEGGGRGGEGERGRGGEGGGERGRGGEGERGRGGEGERGRGRGER